MGHKEFDKAAKFRLSMGDGNKMHSFEFSERIKETENAVLLDFEGEEVWLPKSQIDMRDWSSIVEIPEWLAKSKGLL